MNGQRQRIAQAFAGARDYDRHAKVQREVALGLATRIAALDLPANPRVLEIGCGTGFLTQALIEHSPAGKWLVTDIAPEMVARCRKRVGDSPTRRFAVLDGEHDTPGGGPFDLICSSLALQWFENAPAALTRIAQWLAPGGHCMVTTLGPGSFAEWRAAHEAQGLLAGTPSFASAEAFAAIHPEELLVEAHVEHHANARAFLHAVKAIGAGTSDPSHRPLAPAALRGVMAAFDRSGSNVTYEVVTCHLRRAR